MKNILAIIVILFCATTLFAKKKEKKQDNISSSRMTTYIDSFSYSVGVYFMEQQILPLLKNSGDDTILNKTLFIDGLAAAVKQQSLFTPEQSENIIRQYFEQKSQKARIKDSMIALNNQKIEQEFLEKNKTEPQVQVTSSGLQYKILSEGNGESPQKTSKVKVHYEGKLLNGEIFDSSFERGEPIEFPLENVIEGWQEGLQLIKEGGEILLYIPSKLGYGNKQVGSIPAGSLLVFKVHLLSMLPDEETFSISPLDDEEK